MFAEQTIISTCMTPQLVEALLNHEIYSETQKKEFRNKNTKAPDRKNIQQIQSIKVWFSENTFKMNKSLASFDQEKGKH